MAMEGNYGAKISAARADLNGLERANNNILAEIYNLEGYINDINNAWVNETEDIASKKAIMRNLNNTLNDIKIILSNITQVCNVSHAYLDEMIRANRLGND